MTLRSHATLNFLRYQKTNDLSSDFFSWNTHKPINLLKLHIIAKPIERGTQLEQIEYMLCDEIFCYESSKWGHGKSAVRNFISINITRCVNAPM